MCRMSSRVGDPQGKSDCLRAVGLVWRLPTVAAVRSLSWTNPASVAEGPLHAGL